MCGIWGHARLPLRRVQRINHCGAGASHGVHTPPSTRRTPYACREQSTGHACTLVPRLTMTSGPPCLFGRRALWLTRDGTVAAVGGTQEARVKGQWWTRIHHPRSLTPVMPVAHPLRSSPSGRRVHAFESTPRASQGFARFSLCPLSGESAARRTGPPSPHAHVWRHWVSFQSHPTPRAGSGLPAPAFSEDSAESIRQSPNSFCGLSGEVLRGSSLLPPSSQARFHSSGDSGSKPLLP